MAGEKERPSGSNLATREYGIANRAQQAVFVWRQIPVPVIAAVHGVAFGGGFQLTLGADMRYVAPDTMMADHGDQMGPHPRHDGHSADARIGARRCHP